jgi:hypothetical protein
MRAGTLALMTPVMTLTDGPLGGDDQVDADGAGHLGDAADDSSTSRAATIIRSLSSSTTTTMYGMRSYVRLLGVGAGSAPARHGRTPRCSR